MIKKISKKSQLNLKTMNDVRGGDFCNCGCTKPECGGDWVAQIANLTSAAITGF